MTCLLRRRFFFSLGPGFRRDDGWVGVGAGPLVAVVGCPSVSRDIPTDWLFPPDLNRARAVQAELAGRVIVEDALGEVRLVGGVDISHNPRMPDDPVHGAIVTLDAATMRVAAQAGATRMPAFPYVPGFLGFRECPAIVDAFDELATPPGLIFVDGQGVAHPRGFGIACQLGVILDVPTIGVAKSILCGRPAGRLGEAVGDRVPLLWRGATVGVLLRTKTRCNPLVVSAGHRISLDTAIDRVLAAGRGYRMPEPTRQAHLAANALRRGADGEARLL